MLPSHLGHSVNLRCTRGIDVVEDRAVTSNRWRRWALLIGLTAALTAAIAAVRVPSPALFAGLLVATVLALTDRAPARVPRSATTAAQAVIGVVIGVLVQPSTVAGLATSWFPVLVVGLATLAASVAAGLLLGLNRGVSPLTGALSLIAGGASGVVAISRDLGGDDRLVAVVQYLRVGLVTATTPVVAALWFGASATAFAARAPEDTSWADAMTATALGLVDVRFVDVAFVAGCALLGLPLARLLRIPAGGLLGPMAVAIVLDLAGLSGGATPPALLVELAYAVIGWQAGVRFTRESLRTVLGALPAATALIAALVVACAGLGLLLSRLTGASVLEGYLATTPGGIYAVLATAVSAGVDVTFVVAAQVLRVLLMLLVAPVLARLTGRRGG